jgi:hypothetical protein
MLQLLELGSDAIEPSNYLIFPELIVSLVSIAVLQQRLDVFKHGYHSLSELIFNHHNPLVEFTLFVCDFLPESLLLSFDQFCQVLDLGLHFVLIEQEFFFLCEFGQVDAEGLALRCVLLSCELVLFI